LTCGYWLEL